MEERNANLVCMLVPFRSSVFVFLKEERSMSETRQFKEDAAHPLQRSHLDLPVGFVPLRLILEPERQHLEIDRPMVIVGRHSGAELRLSGEEVSRRHCQFAFENGQWRVCDLHSLNGVYVNGHRIIEATLYAGDLIVIGGV